MSLLEEHRSRGPIAALAVIVAAGLAIRLWLVRELVPNHDEFWHVFVATQSSIEQFAREVFRASHPPLYYLVLRGFVALLGNSEAVWRLPSIVAGCGFIIAVAEATRRLTSRSTVIIFAAAVAAVSAVAVHLSVAIRAYMLAVLLITFALSAYLQVLSDAEPRRSAPLRLALFASFAVFAHYGMILLIVSMILFAVAVAGRGDGRGGTALRALAAPAMLSAAAIVLHAGKHAARFQHVAPFYFDRTTESAGEFLLRNSANLLRIFTPAVLHQRSLLLLTCLVSVSALLWTTREILRRVPQARMVITLAPGALLLLTLALMAAGGILRRYPFGGRATHQSIVLPLVVLTLVVVLDRILESVGKSALVTGTAFLCLFAAAAADSRRVDPDTNVPLRSEVAYLWRLEPSPQSIYVDRYSAIILYGHTTERRWRFAGRPGDAVEMHRIDPGVLVFVDRAWRLDLTDEATYARIADVLAETGVSSTRIFRAARHRSDRMDEGGRRTSSALQGVAQRGGLQTTAVHSTDGTLYVTLRRARRLRNE